MNGHRDRPVDLRAHLTTMGIEPELRRIIDFMSRKSKMISHEFIRKPTHELTGTYNASGDAQIELDVMANDYFLDELDNNPTFGILDFASEEMDEITHLDGFDSEGRQGRYSITIDPIDGSKQVEPNFSVGTIVGIHEGKLMDGRTGRESMRAAMCVFYGPRTTMIYSVPKHTFAFVQDGSGEFMAIYEDPIRLPYQGKILAPGGERRIWTDEHRSFIEALENETVPDAKRQSGVKGRYSMRYAGVCAAEVNRLLLCGGGHFSHPRHTEKGDTLRLLFECQPEAFMVEAADGAATNGIESILDIKPKHIGQREALYIGSKYEVELAKKYLTGEL